MPDPEVRRIVSETIDEVVREQTVPGQYEFWESQDNSITIQNSKTAQEIIAQAMAALRNQTK